MTSLCLGRLVVNLGSIQTDVSDINREQRYDGERYLLWLCKKPFQYVFNRVFNPVERYCSLSIDVNISVLLSQHKLLSGTFVLENFPLITVV